MTLYRITFLVNDEDDTPGKWDVRGMLAWAYSGWPEFELEKIEEVK